MSSSHGALRSSVNVPFLIGTSVLIGAGLTLVTAWLITASWLYFGTGIAACLVGGLLLFQKGTGADSA